MAVDKAAVADDVLTDQWGLTAPADIAQLDKFNVLPGQGFSVAEEQQAEEKDWDQQPMSKAVAAAVEKQKAKLTDLYKVTRPHCGLLCCPIFLYLTQSPPFVFFRLIMQNLAAGGLRLLQRACRFTTHVLRAG
jgi:hypothetical protein